MNIAELQSLSFADFKVFESEFRKLSLQKNKEEFVRELKKLFQEDQYLDFVEITFYSQASVDGMNFGWTFSVEDANGDDIDDLHLFSSDVVELFRTEGSEEETEVIQYSRNFKDFDDYKIIGEDETDSNDLDEDEDQE